MPSDKKLEYLTRKKNHSSGNLKQGRPPYAPKQQATLSKKATQSAIRTHHDLNKKLTKAKAEGDQGKAEELTKTLTERGGLEKYQDASIQGQSNDRGGDSSKILMEWLEDLKSMLRSAKPKLKLLEVGALSRQNACSKSGLFDIERIDLQGRDGITQQDFMDRPKPGSSKDMFDIISLSLVLNFVPDAKGRGEMLKRTCKFLNKKAAEDSHEKKDRFPALFLVLPASCITNSRYTNEELLTLMMASLGYVMLKRKQTAKLIYYLWLLRDKPTFNEQNFPKKEIYSGGQRNNFAIVMKQ